MKKIPCLHWNIQLLKWNYIFYARLIPFMFSFPKLFRPFVHFCKSTLEIFMDTCFKRLQTFSSTVAYKHVFKFISLGEKMCVLQLSL